jgi:hypothetical protein
VVPRCWVRRLEAYEHGLGQAGVFPLNIAEVTFGIGGNATPPRSCGIGTLAGLLLLSALGGFAMAQAFAAAMVVAGEPPNNKQVKVAKIHWGFLRSFRQLKVRLDSHLIRSGRQR